MIDFENLKQSKRSIDPNEITGAASPPPPPIVEEKPTQQFSNMPPRNTESLPPALQAALRNNQRPANDENAVPPSAAFMNNFEERFNGPVGGPVNGPRLGFTGNEKLDSLIAGIKETIYKYEEVELPSKGRFYNGQQAPANGIIHVRCMTGEEEAILATPRYIEKGQSINMIFRNCVREPINPEHMLTVDRTWLLIYLRGISYSPDYEVDLKCPSCGIKFSHTVDLDSMLVDYCPSDVTLEKLTDVLPVSKYKFRYRFATGRDESLITEYRKAKIRKFGDNITDDTWTFRASLLVEEIEGLNDQKSLMALINRLPINDVAYIRSVVNEPPFGVDTKIPVLCPNCSEEFEVDLPMEANFFFPKPRKAKPIPVSS